MSNSPLKRTRAGAGFAPLALIIALALALSACGDSQKATKKAAKEPPRASAPAAAPSLEDARRAPFNRKLWSTGLVEAVPTFQSIGLRWQPWSGAKDVPCLVRYRKDGTLAWREGYPLWFDERAGECRGSLVNLEPGTAYEIELSVSQSGEFRRAYADTWAETPPVLRRVALPPVLSEPLVIGEGGTEAGYVVYEPGPSGRTVIDIGERPEAAVQIKASKVILRGLTIRGGRHGIEITGKRRDIIIEDNDISGWGRIAEDGWGENLDSGIYFKDDDGSLERVVIQRNRIHHPRSDANAWDEYRAARKTSHPGGPQAITLWETDGNHVIRYNEISSDAEHMFNDCVGGGVNFSPRGFPVRDSDIYGNKISHCWDDAIEAEGANRNVRIWQNTLDRSFSMIAMAPTVEGPAYVWRNIADRSQKHARPDEKGRKEGPFLKLQGKKSKRKKDERYFGGGRVYVFHNTLLQREGEAIGVMAGPSDLKGGRMENVVTRNNIFQVSKEWRPSIADNRRLDSNDFDYDLYNGKIRASGDQQTHGIRAEPVFVDDPVRLGYALKPGTPGFDGGIDLPSFNDGFAGAAPDMGAQEYGGAPLRFGLEAAGRSRHIPGS